MLLQPPINLRDLQFDLFILRLQFLIYALQFGTLGVVAIAYMLHGSVSGD